jgi:Ca2+-binding EF-hand superfamily protein
MLGSNFKGTVIMKYPHVTPAILLLGLCAAIPAVGSAQAAAPPTAQLNSMDADHDDTPDQAEVRKAAEAKFDKLDTDHDGTIDKKEVGARLGNKSFGKADTDSDGTIDKAEYLSLVDAGFKAADTDHDGTVSAAELNTKSGRALAHLIH